MYKPLKTAYSSDLFHDAEDDSNTLTNFQCFILSIVPTSLIAEAHTRTTLKTEAVPLILLSYAVRRERTPTQPAIIKSLQPCSSRTNMRGQAGRRCVDSSGVHSSVPAGVQHLRSASNNVL